MKKIRYILSSLFIVTILFTSCEKDFDDPTVKTVPTGTIKTIADIRAMYVPGQTVNITTDISVYGVVTMDESTGNLYKESYITDATGNLYIRFISGSGLYTGDSVLVNLNGAKILKYNQMLQVDSLHPDNNIVKLATQQFQTPEVITISSLLSDLEAAQGKLIQLDNVFFVEGGQGLSYADGVTQTSESRYLQDINGTQIEVRTSGYANFANDTLPSGVGSFIGIAAQYNSGLQLLVRDPNELTLNGEAPITKDFEDQSLSSGGWTTQYPVTNNNWTVASFNSNYYGYVTNGSGKLVGESWLISPSIDLSNSTNPSFSFSTATFGANSNFEVYISTDYDGTSLPATATWTNLTSLVSLSTGSWSWTGSGNINLSTYLQPNVYVAFKYNGTSASWDSWEVDNIIINK